MVDGGAIGKLEIFGDAADVVPAREGFLDGVAVAMLAHGTAILVRGTSTVAGETSAAAVSA